MRCWMSECLDGPSESLVLACARLGCMLVQSREVETDLRPSSCCRTVEKVAQQLYKAGKIKDLCEDADFFTRLTKLEAQYPNASVLVHKQGVLPAEIASLWSSPQLMSAAHQFLGGEHFSTPQILVNLSQGTEAQYPNASVLVYKKGVLFLEIASL